MGKTEDIIDLEKPHIQKRKIKKGRGRPSSKAVDADNRHQSKAREDKQPRVGKSAVEREVSIDESDGTPGCAMEDCVERRSLQ